MRLRTLIPLLAVLLLPAGPGRAAPAQGIAPARPALLRDDPLLQEKVTLEATDRPLGEVLALLSPRLKVDLTASPGIADQRVTLRLTDQPVYLLLNRLPALLGHATDRPHGYYWEKLGRPAGGRPAFNLWRDLRSVQDEEYERHYPRREAAVLLRDLRNMARMTDKERAAYKSDYRYFLNPQDASEAALGKALKGLTDDQLDGLLDGREITLDPAAFTEELAAFKKRQRDKWKHEQELDRMVLGTERFPNGFPAQPDFAPVLSVTRADRDGEYPDDTSRYYIALSCLPDELPVLDAYDTLQSRGPWPPARPAPAKAAPGAVLDLAPLLSEKAATPARAAISASPCRRWRRRRT